MLSIPIKKVKISACLGVLLCFMILGVSCDTKSKSEKGPDWWYEAKSSPVSGDHIWKPAAEKGFSVQSLVENEEVRKLFDGRTITNHLAYASDGKKAVWLMRFRIESPYWRRPEKKIITSKENDYAFVLVSWDSKSGLKILEKRLDFLDPQAVEINRKELDGCQVGDVLVAGIRKRTLLPTDIEGWQRQKAWGPTYGEVACVSKGFFGTKYRTLYKSKDPLFTGFKQFTYDETTDGYWYTSSLWTLNPYNDEMTKVVRRPGKPKLEFGRLSLVSGNKEVALEAMGSPNSFPVRESIFLEKKLMLALNGNHQVLICRVGTDFKCSVSPVSPQPVSSLDKGTGKNELVFSVYSHKTGERTMMGSVFKLDTEKLLKGVRQKKSTFFPVESLMLGTNFYSVAKISVAQQGILVWDYVASSRLGNNLYFLSAQEK